MFGRSLRLPLALCSVTDAVATMCNRSHLSASAGCAARLTTCACHVLSVTCACHVLSATCACHVLSADLRVNFHPRDASATSRPVLRAQGSMTSWMLTDAVSSDRVSSFSKVARRSGLQHVHVLGLSLGTTRLAAAPIQPNHAGCGNSLSNIKPATVLRLRRAPCSQTSAGSLRPRVCAPRRHLRHISLDCRAETRS